MIRFILLFLFLLQLNVSYSQDGYIEGNPALAYWQLGGKTETIIVLHGGPAVQHEYLRPEFDELSKAAKVIYYDQRGCGKSAVADSYVWQEHVKDLKRVITTFSKGKKVILAGSSWGSLLAMIYSYTHPEDVKGVILSGTVRWPGKGIPIEDYKPMPDKHIMPKTEKIQLSEEQRILVQTGDAYPQSEFIIKKKESEVTWGPAQFQPLLSFVTAPVVDSLKRIQIPVLIFSGDKEPCTTNLDWGKRYAEIFPKAELCIISGSCHDPWFADPDKFFTKSKEFVSILNKNR